MSNRHQYYWIVAVSEGKPYLIFGSNNSEEEARHKGIEMLGGLDFQIRRFPTRDVNAASAFLRGKRLESTHSLRDSSRRIGHDKSIARMRHRRQASPGWN